MLSAVAVGAEWRLKRGKVLDGCRGPVHAGRGIKRRASARVQATRSRAMSCVAGAGTAVCPRTDPVPDGYPGGHNNLGATLGGTPEGDYGVTVRTA